MGYQDGEERTWVLRSTRGDLRGSVNDPAGSKTIEDKHTCSANTYERRLDSDLSFAQLLWRRSNIVLDPDVFLSVIPRGAHLLCSIEGL